jgi:ABC-2 type transport system ATP-binding protein
VPAVEASGLAKRYSDVIAVADVSLSAAAGQVTAILGPNGAGKTTTVEICAGLRRSDAGRVTVLGLDPSRESAELHRRVGVMPQGGSSASGVYPSARAAEVLRHHAALHAQPLPVDALVERLGLTKVAGTPWRRLSGGEQQRLSLALAIVGRPEVLFLDEPTAGLDVAGRHSTWDLIRDLRAAGVGVVLTTHALDEAELLADQVIIVDAGRVVAHGTPAELTRGDAATAAELRFDAPAALPLGDLRTAAAPDLEVTETSPGRYLVAGVITPDTVATVTAWCASHGVMPDRLTTASRTLEDVFVELTSDDESPS